MTVKVKPLNAVSSFGLVAPSLLHLLTFVDREGILSLSLSLVVSSPCLLFSLLLCYLLLCL